jgi:hypothetical protein
LVPISPNTRSIVKFAKSARRFTALQELRITAALSHPNKYRGGKGWRKHDNTTEDIISVLKSFETIFNLKEIVHIDVEISKSKAIGCEADISHYQIPQ